MSFKRKVLRNTEAIDYGVSKSKYYPLKRSELSSLDEKIKDIELKIKDTKNLRKKSKLISEKEVYYQEVHKIMQEGLKK